MIVRVTAKVAFVYDLDETEKFGIDSPEAAVEDMHEVLPGLSPSDFEIDWMEVDTP